jgi:hypothetical protein
MNTRDPIILALPTLVGVLAFLAIATAQVPNSIAAPGETVVLKVHAEGAQVYECKASPDAKLVWQFREPIATLIADGNIAMSACATSRHRGCWPGRTRTCKIIAGMGFRYTQVSLFAQAISRIVLDTSVQIA